MNEIEIQGRMFRNAKTIECLKKGKLAIRFSIKECLAWWEMDIAASEELYIKSLTIEEEQIIIEAMKKEYIKAKQTGKDVHVFGSGKKHGLFLIRTFFESVDIDEMNPENVIFQEGWNKRREMVRYSDETSIYGVNEKECKEDYSRILQSIHCVKESVEELTEEGYCIYGNWEDTSFSYYFYHNANRKMNIVFEDGEIGFHDEKETILFHSIEKEDMKKVLRTYLDRIKIKERLFHVCKEEKVSYLFLSLFGLTEKEARSRQSLWEELRKTYSFEELEKKCLEYKKTKKSLFDRDIADFHIGEAFDYHIGFFPSTSKYFIARTKEKLAELLAEEHKQYMTKVLKENL